MTAQPNGRTYEFGIRDRLRTAREQAGFDQAEFADVTGLSRGTISNYERGVTPPRRPALLAWAFATGFDREWLETGLNSDPTTRHDGTCVVVRRLPDMLAIAA